MPLSETETHFDKQKLSMLKIHIGQYRNLITTTYLGQILFVSILAFNIWSLARNIEHNTLMYCPIHIMGSMIAICAGAALQYIKVKTKRDKQELEKKIKTTIDKITKINNNHQIQGKTL
jgi:hypothetical protein